MQSSSTTSVTVTPVCGRRDRRDFVALPFALYARDARWVGPMRSSVLRAMDVRKNAFFREAFVEHFVARDGSGRCVGRVAGIIHPDHVRRHGDKAFFGHFECVDDARVATRLLAAVEAWAEARGVRTVQGPCTYAMTQDAGLLVDGFDQPPVLLHCYNPGYYVTLLGSAGYRPAFEMSTYAISRDDRAVALATRRGDAAAEALGLRARSLDMARFDAELEAIRLCYNQAFVAHPETVAISREVFADQAREMKSVVDPRLVRIVERDGVAVAFAVALPNVCELLSPTQGKLTLRLLLRFRQELARVRSVVVLMIGAAPSLGDERSTGQGVGSVLAAQLAHALAEPFEVVHTTWIHEKNWRARALMRAIGAKQLKRYAIFQKDLN